ncbi:MAG TPA: HAD-IA family hydrolase [Oligoflexus sp.]|uniref:HAD family hydrolase n=1 Tax=Oligoflexus sp. TaxID=1971216 RepID=UPI002D3AE8AC|nr:HAD-IA family hydrolase [Oligoflexus sp.]HYX38359.1 HAD-IA family hydrolase [Oligoflexus sp.]
MKDWKQFKGVIFDLDGTLYEYRWLKLQLIRHNLRFLSFLMKLEKGRDAVRWASFPDQNSLVAESSRVSSPRNPQAFQQWYENTFYPSFIGLLRPHMKRPEAGSLLRTLKGHGMKLAVCSDYGFVGERLDALSLDRRIFDVLISAEENGHLKPQIFTYLKILNELDLDANQVLIVGDRMDTDGIAAKELGAAFYTVQSNEDWVRLFKMLELSR